MEAQSDVAGARPVAKSTRMRRVPGGRHRQLFVRLTDEEEQIIRRRAGEAGLSAPRFVIEAALSGSAGAAGERRMAAREARSARVILKGVANNLNQMAKWANANGALPDHLDEMVADLSRVVGVVEQTTVALGAALAPTHGRADPMAMEDIP